MITVSNISKMFPLPHERKRTLKEYVLDCFKGRKSASEPLQVLKDVSFHVNKGEFFSIIGKNGSGKSTLLKILSNIYVPDTGSVSLGGSLSPFLELGIGFNPDLTARENVFISAAVLGLSRKEIEGLYDGIIGFSELEKFQDQHLKNFSSGMNVRLAFSVAFMVQADILLIDEVLAVGDASFQEKCYDVFRRMKGEGKTIIFVSHGMGDVCKFSDRALLLHEGRVVSIGEPDKVVHDYQLLTAYEDEKRIAMEEQPGKERGEEGEKVFTPPADENRWGSGEVRVKGVSFFDGGGHEKHVFATGEELRVKVAYELRAAKVESLGISVSIHRADGVCVLETNASLMKRGRRGVRGEGDCELVFPGIELLAATYYLDVGLYPAGTAPEPYDFRKNFGMIRIYQDTDSVYGKAGGISYLEHDWRVPAGGRDDEQH